MYVYGNGYSWHIGQASLTGSGKRTEDCVLEAILTREAVVAQDGTSETTIMADASVFTNASSANASTNYSYPAFKLFTDEMILAYNVFLSLTIAFGVPGNLLVLIVFMKMKVSTSTDCFIIFITSLDFISSVFNVPVYLTFTNGMWRQYGSDSLCKLHMFFSQAVVVSSALLTSGLAVERFLKVCRPHSIQLSKTKARNVCLFFCFLATLASIPSAFLYSNMSGVCTSGELVAFGKGYFTAIFALFIAVFVVVSFCYIRICFAINHSAKKIAANRRFSTQLTYSNNQSKVKRALFGSSKVYPSGTSLENHVLRSKQCTSEGCTKDSANPSSVVEEPDKEIVITVTSPKDKKLSKLSGTNTVQSGQIIWTTTVKSSEGGPTKLPMTPVPFDKSPAGIQSNEANQSTQIILNRNKTQTTKIAFLVCVIFIISWIIPWVCFVLLQLKRTVALFRFALFGRMTYLVNTFTNPFLYGWLNLKFRQKLKACFRIR